MSSRILYPPVIDSYMPAFQAGENQYCRVYFSLSKFNGSSDYSSLHVSVTKQTTGMNVVKANDVSTHGRYRATGIILNVKPQAVDDEDNLYYFDIYNEDLSSQSGSYTGWIPGWIYKIQIRLSAADYDGSIGQAAWLNNNASEFSEWSTICTTKAIGHIQTKIPIFDYDSDTYNPAAGRLTIYASTLDIAGELISEDPSEVLYSTRFKLYSSNHVLLEDSGELFSNKYQNQNEFKYLAWTELKDEGSYTLSFTYTTNNKFTETTELDFYISLIQADRLNCTLITADNDSYGLLKNVTSIHEEEQEGRLGLKIYSPTNATLSSNICIMRSSSRDNFKEWHDIKILVVKNEIINNLDVVYDYTVESGVWYQYGVQSIDIEGNRGVLIKGSKVMRNFEYSYLLGENNQQLKLMFNNAMDNYKIQQSESKSETVGSKYPIITRNAAVGYRIIPINGLISFWMDEVNLFCNKRVVYGNSSIAKLYDNYNIENGIMQYDYIYEREFRQMVLDFLHDGKPKLFKSPTEGNIIVRLMDINCQPQQSLDRMIYAFTSTGNELAECTPENLLKYGFLDPGEWSDNLSLYHTKLGQLQMAFKVGSDGDNIFNEIYKKYDSQDMNYAGFRRTLTNIMNVSITIDDRPLRVLNTSGAFVVGNNFNINGTIITIMNPAGRYDFDDRLTYTAEDELYLLGDAEGKVEYVNATIDFLYEIEEQPYVAKKVRSRNTDSGIAQVFAEYQPGDSIYNEIYYKYYIEWPEQFRRLNSIAAVMIEANPYAAFLIKDEDDTGKGEVHVINETGLLDLFKLSNIVQLKYLGMQDPRTGEIDTTKPADVLMNYFYSVSQGYYKESDNG